MPNADAKPLTLLESVPAVGKNCLFMTEQLKCETENVEEEIKLIYDDSAAVRAVFVADGYREK